MIYKATGNLRAIQILLGHTKIENTVRYLGVDIEDAWNWPNGRKSELALGGEVCPLLWFCFQKRTVCLRPLTAFPESKQRALH